MKVLSFGGGVQTVTIAAMCCLDEFERPDHVVFSDTQWETKATYAYLEWFSAWAMQRGMEILRTTAGNIRSDALDPGKRFASMPLFTETGQLMPSGKKEDGRIRRQCTREYKVDPVNRVIRGLAGLKSRQRWKGDPCELWLGISTDEAAMRVKDNREKWIKNRWPLIELNMRRGGCVEWLRRHGVPVPPKSACIGCPNHNNPYWLALKRDSPEEWASACNFDDAIRKHRVSLRNAVYLHRSLVPLREANINEDQPDMFENECEGFCGT